MHTGRTRTFSFTMVEMLVVTSIIVVLAAMIWPAITTVRQKSAKTRAESYSKMIRNDPALLRYYTFSEGDGQTLHNLAVGRPDDMGYQPDTYDAEFADDAPTWIVGGGRFANKPGLQFDGDDDHVAMKGEWYQKEKWDACTVAAWVKSSKEDGRQAIVSMDPDEAWQLSLKGDHPADWETVDSSNFPHKLGVKSSARDAFRKLTDGRWHLIVGTYDRNDPVAKKRLFIDGVEVESGELNDDEPNPHNDRALRSSNVGLRDPRYGYIGVGSAAGVFNKGGGQARTGTYFHGYIDEILVFKRALAPAEVKAMYESTKP